jgi:hypothetical protein
MRSLLLAGCLALVAPTLTACDKPIVVDTDPKKLKRLPLRGEVDRTGTLTSAVDFNGQIIQKRTTVVVRETWIVRRDPRADPPGYRIGGYYDSTKRTEGFVLPPGRADIYFVSAIRGPQGEVGRIPIPIEAFQLNP